MRFTAVQEQPEIPKHEAFCEIHREMYCLGCNRHSCTARPGASGESVLPHSKLPNSIKVRTQFWGGGRQKKPQKKRDRGRKEKKEVGSKQTPNQAGHKEKQRTKNRKRKTGGRRPPRASGTGHRGCRRHVLETHGGTTGGGGDTSTSFDRRSCTRCAGSHLPSPPPPPLQKPAMVHILCVPGGH